MAGDNLIFRLVGIDAGATRTVERLGVASAATAKQLESIGAASATTAAKTTAVFGKIGKASAVLGVGFVAYGAKQASEFNRLTNVYVTAAGESLKGLKVVQKGVLDVATSTGTAWQDVAKAEYTIEKAGIHGAAGLTILKAAAQGAKEENADLATVVNASTSIIADYHLKASDAVMVTNEMKTAAGEAKVTFEQFDKALSVVVPLASKMHISFADIAGTLAEVTQHGVSADEAAQQLAFAMRNLGGNISGVAQNEMAQFGISAVDVQSKIGDGPGGRGLAGTLNYLSETVLHRMGPSGMVLLSTFNQSKVAAQAVSTEMAALAPATQKVAKQYQAGAISAKEFRAAWKGMPSDQAALAKQFQHTEDHARGFQSTLRRGLSNNQTYTQALQKMTGGANGLQAALQVAGTSSDSTNEKIKRIAESAKNAGKDVSGWASTLGLSSTQADRFKQTMQKLAIEIGEHVLPMFTKIAGYLADHAGLMEAATVAVIGLGAAWLGLKVVGIISGITRGIGGLVSALGGLTVANEAAVTSEAELAVGGAAAADAILAEEAAMGGLATSTAAVGTAGGRAAGGVGKLGGSFKSAGLLLGGAAAVGIAALALDIKQIMNDSIKGLPYVDKIAGAISHGGVGGKAATAVVNASLSQIKTGNERGESVTDYVKRTTTQPEAAKFANVPALSASGVKNARVKDVGASYANLMTIIQKGGKEDLQQFIANYDQLQHLLNASPATITQVDDAITALFNRFNTGRDNVDRVTAAEHKYLVALHDQAVAEKQAGTAASANSTSAARLAKVYSLSAGVAKQLASDNSQYAYDLSVVGGQMAQFNKTMVGNTESAKINRRTIGDAAEEVKAHALEVYKDTGSMAAANAVFSAGIGTITSNAAAVGANTDQVINYIAKQLGIQPSRVTQFLTPGLDNANGGVGAYLASLKAIPQNVITTVTMMYGSAFPTSPNDPRITGHKAAGGYITGAGTGTSDSIPTMLSRGEFVVNARSTAAFRPLLEGLNNKSFNVGVGSAPLSKSATSGGDTYQITINAVDAKSFKDFVNNPQNADAISNALSRRARP